MVVSGVDEMAKMLTAGQEFGYVEMLQWCYNGVTLLWGYNDVTLVFHGVTMVVLCYGVTMVLRWCFMVLQRCYFAMVYKGLNAHCSARFWVSEPVLKNNKQHEKGPTRGYCIDPLAIGPLLPIP